MGTHDDLPLIVSVDDHVVEPAHLFERWLPQRFRSAGPRSIRTGVRVAFHGGADYRVEVDDEAPVGDVWQYEDVLVPLRRNIAAAGFSRDEIGVAPITYDEMRRGCHDPVARLGDMDLNGVEASLCFPTFPRFCGQTFAEAADKELALACVRAYNDWMVEEWCGDSGGRLVPLCLVPLWDPELAAAEVRRNAERGVRAVTFSEVPAKLGLPSIHTGYWDPFFAACEQTATVVNLHIGSSSTTANTSADAPAAVQITLSFNYSVISLSDWLFSGVFVRFPDLVVAYSEGQMGWIPFLLQRADDVWLEHRGWAGVADLLPEPPSAYFARNVYACFFRDAIGLQLLEEVGVDRITFETDYPHTDTTWPHTREVAAEMLAGLEPDVVRKLLRGNAIGMLGLDLAP